MQLPLMRIQDDRVRLVVDYGRDETALCICGRRFAADL
jgi:hypothetical protein